jgi:predicted transcriptional regulator
MLVKEVMSPPFPVVDSDEDLRTLMTRIDKSTSAILVKIDTDKYHIITRQDLITALR